MRRTVHVPGDHSAVTSADGDRRVERRLNEMERELEAMARELGLRDMRAEQGEGTGRPILDARWACRKCGLLLAWYDPRTDVLRVRYKDHRMYAKVGGASGQNLLDAVAEGLDREGIGIEEDALYRVAQLVADQVTPGFAQVVCRGCGEINTVNYASEEEVEAAQAEAKASKP